MKRGKNCIRYAQYGTIQQFGGLITLWLFVLVAGFSPSGSAQSLADITSLKPSYINHFAEDNLAYSNKCFSDVLMDDSGQLWLNVCGQERVINALGLFQFDGDQFRPIELIGADNELLNGFALKGQGANGRLFGTAWNSFFAFDMDTRAVQAIPFADSSLSEIIFSSFARVDSTIYVMGYSTDKYIRLFREERGFLVEEQVFDYSEGNWGIKHFPLIADSTEFWLMGGTFPLFRYDREKGEREQYDLKDLVGASEIMPSEGSPLADQYPVLQKNKDGTVYLYLPDYYGNQFFVLDREKNRFFSMANQFPGDWTPKHLFQDESGNLCFLFEDKFGQYKAILEEEAGQRFDYSGVVSVITDIRQLLATDFRQQVFAVGNDGLFNVGIREEQSVRQAMPGQWISAMAPFPDDQLLVNTVKNGWFVYDEKEGKSVRFVAPDCGLPAHIFAKGMKQQLIPDEEGELWMIAGQYLLKYHPVTHSCEAYDLGRLARLFCFINQDLVAVQFGQFELGFYDLNKQETMVMSDLLPAEFDALIRDIFLDSKGMLWVLTNEGLWKIDVYERESQRFTRADGFADIRFTAIYEDDKGRLWLGTYYGGLHIFDPKNGEMMIIDKKKGLSNNAIMSILPDDDGDLWVSTEYGINIVSPEGEVLNSLYEEEGLIYNVYERFDPLKMADGRLCFGSRKGISIIDPTLVKAAFKKSQEVKIYLTELTFFDEEKGKNTTVKEGLQSLSLLEIPAEQPGIHLRFGLSSYLEPQKQRYAYQLEGKDNDWHYIGAEPELYISRLPPGKYNLLIKGADFRNNWTAEPLRIPLRVEQFFYKRAWFHLLLAAPFILFGLIWARSKKLEASRLEQEVDRRTHKIVEDKEVIVRQAQELQQLDELKTRFFTNISHELRTPVTLIKIPLEKILHKSVDSLEQSLADSLHMVFRNATKLGKLVEELLELSQLDANKVSLQETPTSFNTFCRQLFSAYASAAEMKQIDYTFYSDLPEGAVYLVDRNRLEKIINNLLANALKFTPSGGKVRFSLLNTNNQLIAEVQDNGRGVPPEDVPNIFDRYYQTKRKDNSPISGNGIGLALSRELALLMKGDLSVQSVYGQGATFQLRLPLRLVEGHAMTSTPIPRPTVVAPVATPSLPVFVPNGNNLDASKGKLLIVEDNHDMQQLLLTLLQEQYECQVVSNGAEAWRMLESKDKLLQGIDLIISDVMMPEMDGYTLLKKIKAHRYWKQLPVIMLTARAAEEDKLEALRIGVDDYLLKPFSSAELTTRVDNLITNYKVRASIPADEKSNITFDLVPSADSEWLKTVEQFTMEAFDKRFKLSAAYLAAQLFMSERQFARKLKAATGLTPSRYIQEAKLSMARHLLECKAYNTVNEVAVACGYSSSSYLAKIFQERFGKMPGDYLL